MNPIESPINKMIISADPGVVGKRVDAFLAERFLGEKISRASILRLIKEGHISSNLGPFKPSSIIKGNEEFVISLPETKPSKLRPQNIALDIIYSDEHIAVINKPHGMVVHPGAGAFENTLCHALLYHFPHMQVGDSERPGIVHRLDKDTSGVMVVAKSNQAHLALSQAFKQRRVSKVYRAFCVGEIAQDAFDLKTGHVRHPYQRLRFFTGLPVPLLASKNVRFAHTHIKVMCRAFGFSEVIATIHTGRTHQIRAHLADIGHPLLGDELYGAKRELSKQVPANLKEAINGLSGQALHASSLSFDHPIDGNPLHFVAALPPSLVYLSQSFLLAKNSL